MPSLEAVCDKVWDISDPTDFHSITSLAAEAADANAPDAVRDSVDNALRSASGAKQLALWYLVDKLCKQDPQFIEVFRQSLVDLATSCSPAPGTAEHQSFGTVLDSLRHAFGPTVIALIQMKLGEASASKTPALADTTAAASVTSGAGASGALTVPSKSLKSFGGFMAQRGNTAQPAPSTDGRDNSQLQLRTRDSLAAVRIASMYAPAMPTEITVPMPTPSPDAPEGHMIAVPAGHEEEYLDKRKRGMREMFERMRRGEAAGDEKKKRKVEAAVPKARVDFSDINMPLEFPRDEYGVQIGNFPVGVQFLRDALRQCGGALELTVLEQRLATTEDLNRGIGNLREFISIHKPTFRVVQEQGRWIVRLADDPSPDPSKSLSWMEAVCPGCGRVVAGRNLPRHENSKKCVAEQIMLGLEGKGTSPVCRLAQCAANILRSGGFFDDDDIDAFAESIAAAGNVRRFRLISPRHFMPILRAVRLVRDKFVESKQCAAMSDVVVTWEDRSTVNLFEQLGRYMRRMPLSWIETGDIIDMCKRFSVESKEPFHPPPMPADPRIRPRNEYPGFLFADSEEDPDEKYSDTEEEFSDDEGAQFEFAPPVSVMETVMVAGIERDTKRLNHRLKTAPPIPATVVTQATGTQSMQEVYKSVQEKTMREAGAGTAVKTILPSGGSGQAPLSF